MRKQQQQKKQQKNISFTIRKKINRKTFLLQLDINIFSQMFYMDFKFLMAKKFQRVLKVRTIFLLLNVPN